MTPRLAPLTAAVASAEERDTEPALRGTAPARALELTAGSGLGQAFGSVAGDGPSFDTIAKNGPTLQLGVGWRFDPELVLGGCAEAAMHRPASGRVHRRRRARANGVVTPQGWN